MMDVEWFDRLWLATLAFTAGVICVFLIRLACRRLFGPEAAATLWLLPVLAPLATQWPHVADSEPTVAFAALIRHAVPQAPGLPSHDSISAHDLLVVIWVVGLLVYGCIAFIAQRRFRHTLRGSQRHVFGGVTILQASTPGVGPALVGAWHPDIVLPADFEARYAPPEQALILAHERMHAFRHDGMRMLLAHACVALMWFNPLAWWSLRLFRHDQELACDAAVLRSLPGRRRDYASAMLKTQRVSTPLPVGCHWSLVHPLTERISMLKITTTTTRRRMGALALALVMGMATVAAYAMGGPATSAGASAVTNQLSIVIKKEGDIVAQPVMCMADGKPAQVQAGAPGKDGAPEFKLLVTLTRQQGDTVKLRVVGDVRQQDGTLAKIFPSAITRFDQQGTIDFYQLKPRMQLLITATRDCPYGKAHTPAG